MALYCLPRRGKEMKLCANEGEAGEEMEEWKGGGGVYTRAKLHFWLKRISLEVEIEDRRIS